MTKASPSPLETQAPAQEAETPAAGGCCGGPAPQDPSACCVRDAEVKSAGGAGCGCSSAPAVAQKICCS
jgi:hypothetical protein